MLRRHDLFLLSMWFRDRAMYVEDLYPIESLRDLERSCNVGGSECTMF